MHALDDPAALGFSTRQVHAGQQVEGAHGSRITPLYLSAGFVFDDLDEAAERFSGGDGFSYTRLGNPTSAAVERKLTALEGGVDTILVGSGQAASSVALLALLGAGDHLVSAIDIYEGTRSLFREVLGRLGIEVDFVEDTHDPAAWAERIRPNTKALWAETIANPRNRVLDLDAVTAVAHAHGVPLVVDSTLATPYLLRPIEHGADVVVHSTSKFLSGHGAALGGAIVDGGRFDWAASGRFPHLVAQPVAPAHLDPRALFSRYARDVIASRLGPTPSPFNAFLLQQGLETLSLRMRQHVANAAAVAEWLAAHPLVESVDYAGLPTHPSHEIARRLLPAGAGSVFSFTLRGGGPAARAVHDSVALFTRMTHLGDVRSLIQHPATTSHIHASAADRAAAGIGDGLLRLSIGIEDAGDLIADLDQAFARIPGATATSADAPAEAITPVAERDWVGASA